MRRLDCDAFRAALIEWYRAEARDLPWRKTTDPYAIWVSEVMLQQTQVKTVTPYFERFLEAFPTLASLRTACETDVLAVWQGLGYYRRAKNLLAAAKRVREMPSDARDLKALPGIGEYTASAVASIAFGKRHAVVDGNVERVVSRLLCVRETGCRLREKCEAASLLLMGDSHPGEWNQALMELGSTVCRPGEPLCGKCPVNRFCKSFATNRTHRFPAAVGGGKPIRLRHACACAVADGKFGLRSIGEGKWWAGMWEFPRIELANGERAELALAKVGHLDLSPLATIRHTVTNHSITLQAFLCANPDRRQIDRWVPLDELDAIPLPSPQRRIAGIAVQAVLPSR